jgi:hypothetical protein
MSAPDFDPDAALAEIRKLTWGFGTRLAYLVGQLDESLQRGGDLPRDWVMPVGGDPYVPPELEACESVLDTLREWASAERPFELAPAHPRSYAAGYAQAARDALEILGPNATT